MRIGRNRIQPYSPSIDNIQTVSNFYGVDSEMLSSEKSIFENYDCGDPCQRKNVAVMVMTMHQNGLHDILPVLYKVASILATIPATSCSAERSFSALRCIKTFLRPTMGQDRLSSIAVINIERGYANKTMQNDMQRIIDIFGRRSNRCSYFFKSFISHFMVLYFRNIDLDLPKISALF